MFFVFCYPNLKYTSKIISNIIQWIRSSPPDVFLGKGVLKIHSTFTGEHTEVWSNFPANIRLQKTSSGRLDQDEYVCLSLTSSEDVFKTSSRRLGQDQYIRLGHTSSRRLQDVLSRRLQDVLKTSSRRLAKTYSRRFEDVFKTSSRYLQDVFKTSSRRLAKISSRLFQDISSS